MTTTKTTLSLVVALALAVSLAACGGRGPSPGERASEVATALQGLATDPVALVSSQASAEVRDNIEQLFVPGLIVKPDVASWAPDGPNKGTMVVTVEPPDQDPRTITVVVIIEDSDWKIFDVVPEEPPASPSDPPETGLTIKPTVFESLGRPPEVVEEKAGKFQEAYFAEGYLFVFGDYTFGFTDSIGGENWGDLSSLRAAGNCKFFVGELGQIVESTFDWVGISDLDALFGQVGEWIEPEQTEVGFWYGGIEYEFEGTMVQIGFSEDNDGKHFELADLAQVWLIWEADRD
ncbi:MAG: hypothetical protein FWD29_07965 [Micrococcales bacterium]|nr:hypothetical protein [Micrococcales bacterium]